MKKQSTELKNIKYIYLFLKSEFLHFDIFCSCDEKYFKDFQIFDQLMSHENHKPVSHIIKIFPKLAKDFKSRPFKNVVLCTQQLVEAPLSE